MIKQSRTSGSVPLDFELNGEHYYGEAKKIKTSSDGAETIEMDVTLNNENLGTIYQGSDKSWTLKNLADQRITDKIGELITQFNAA